MTKKIGIEEIQQINELYYKYHTYAEVARQTGFAPSTIKKYVDSNWQPRNEKSWKRFNSTELPEFKTDIFKGIKNLGELCVLSNEEKKEIEELWEELEI